MGRRGIALVLLATAVGCGRGSGKSPHPLAGRDPAAGFVADAYAATASLIDFARQEEIGNPGRLLAVADPLCAARLALLAEQQLGTCPGGDCPKTSDADPALAAFAGADLSPVPVAAAEALDRWAAVAVAHAALGIANLLDQVDELSQADVAAIRGAADALLASASSPGATETLDWKTVLAQGFQAGPVGETVLFHPPAPRPSKALADAAEGVIGAVASALAPFGDALPFGPDLPALDPAIQTLLRMPSVLDFGQRDDLAGAAGAVHAAGRTLAGKASARTLAAVDWSGWSSAVAPWDLGVARRCAWIERCVPLGSFPIPALPPGASLDDPNARDYVANVPDRPADRLALRPHVELRTGGDALPRGTRAGGLAPIGSEPPPESGVDRAAALPSGAIVVHWTIRSNEPIDHLDLRIHRQDGPDFVHFVYRPDSLGRIATTTTFLPSSDPVPPVIGDSIGRIHYEIVMVAVDRLNRSSGPTSTTVYVAARERTSAERFFFADETGVIRFAPPETELDTVGGTTITAEPFTRLDGTPGVGLTPWTLAGQTGGASVTFQNRDTEPHHLRSVYTPPYRVDPYATPTENAVGGVLPLDFGVVAPGGSSTIVLPASLPAGYRWNLMDVLDTTPPARRPPKVILTTEPPRSHTSSPIGG